MRRAGWVIGFGLILIAAALGIASQTFWQFLSAGVGLVILGVMPFVDEGSRRPRLHLVIAFLTAVFGLSVIAGTLGGGGL